MCHTWIIQYNQGNLTYETHTLDEIIRLCDINTTKSKTFPVVLDRQLWLFKLPLLFSFLECGQLVLRWPLPWQLKQVTPLSMHSRAICLSRQHFLHLSGVETIARAPPLPLPLPSGWDTLLIGWELPPASWSPPLVLCPLKQWPYCPGGEEYGLARLWVTGFFFPVDPRQRS